MNLTERHAAWKGLADSGIAMAVAGIFVGLGGGVFLTLPGGIPLSMHGCDRPWTVLIAMVLWRVLLTAPAGSTLADRLRYVASASGSVVRRVGTMRVLYVLAFLLAAFLVISPTACYYQFGCLPDLCIHVEGMHSALRGELFREPFNYYNLFHVPADGFDVANPTTAFADHFKPILFLYLPFFMLVPSAVTLFVIQAVLVASGIFPLFWLARRQWGRDLWALVLAVAYCCYPTVQGTALSFFPCVAPLSFLLWAFWWARIKRYRLMWLFLLLTLLSKELMALPVVSFGAYLFLLEKDRVRGTCVAATGALWFLACLYWIIPWFTPDGQYAYLGLYSPGASSMHEMILTTIRHPREFLAQIPPGQITGYLVGLLAPLAFVPVIGWKVWLLSLPVLAQNALCIRDFGVHSQAEGLWSAPIVSFSFVAVVRAVQYLRGRFSENVARCALGILLIASIQGIPSIQTRGLWRGPHLIAASEAVSRTIAKGSRVSTNIWPAWSQWCGSYALSLFPFNMADQDFVVLWLPGRPDRMPGQGRSEAAEEPAAGQNPSSEVGTIPREVMEARRCQELIESGEFDCIWSMDDKEGGRVVILRRATAGSPVRP